MRRVVLPSLLALAVVVACGPKASPSTDSESTALAQDGTDANEVESQASSLSASLTLAAGSAAMVPTAQALANAATTTASFYFPSQCLVVTRPAQNRVQYVFDDCTGPWGILHVTGTLVATLTDTAAGLQIDVGDGIGGPATLHFNKAVAAYQATALVTSGGGLKRSMTWTGALDGTTARGRAFSRSASWTIGWTIGESCVSIDGSAEGDVTGRKLKTVVARYSRCRGQCPSSGMVTITNETTQKSVAIAYDGTAIATFTGIDGKTYDITLACGL
jgi:hypothetical protein